MYLLIPKKGEVVKTNNILDEHKTKSDAGELQIICVAGDHPRQYNEGGFHDIDLVTHRDESVA